MREDIFTALEVQTKQTQDHLTLCEACPLLIVCGLGY